jgi:hypothetical protein
MGGNKYRYIKDPTGRKVAEAAFFLWHYQGRLAEKGRITSTKVLIF